MSPASDGPLDRIAALAPLRYPGYRLLAASMAPHLLAMQMGMVAMGYLAYTLSGSATVLGLVSLGWGIPMLVLSLVGGVVADRVPRRSILLGTQSLTGLSALLAAVLLLTGVIQVWHIFIVALIQGIAFAFNMPARQALIAELVEPPHLGSAIAFSNTLMNASRVLGPPIAGLLIAAPTIGVNGVYVLMSGIYLVVLLTLWRLPRRPAPAHRREGGWSSLVDGLGFIRRSPALLGLLALGFAPMFFGMPHQMLLPVFALGVLNVGPEGLGLLNMASGVGAVVGSLAITFVSDEALKRRVQWLLGLLFGAGLVAFAFSASLLPAALMLGLVGAASAGYMALNNSLIMAVTPREYHGRVMSVYMMTWALMPIASLPAARLADIIGGPATVGGMGVLLVASVLGLSLGLQRRDAARAAAAEAIANGD